MKKKLPWSLFLPPRITNWRRRKHSRSRSPPHSHHSRLRSRSRTRSKSRHQHRSRSASHDRGRQDRYWFYTNLNRALSKLVLLSGMCLGTATSNKCKVRWALACDEKIVTLGGHIQRHSRIGSGKISSKSGIWLLWVDTHGLRCPHLKHREPCQNLSIIAT